MPFFFYSFKYEFDKNDLKNVINYKDIKINNICYKNEQVFPMLDNNNQFVFFNNKYIVKYFGKMYFVGNYLPTKFDNHLKCFIILKDKMDSKCKSKISVTEFNFGYLPINILIINNKLMLKPKYKL